MKETILEDQTRSFIIMHSFNPNNPWRLVSTAIYAKPTDSRIMGSVELDVTDLEQWVLRKREEGMKITLMFPLILFTARALKTEIPELLCQTRSPRPPAFH